MLLTAVNGAASDSSPAEQAASPVIRIAAVTVAQVRQNTMSLCPCGGRACGESGRRARPAPNPAARPAPTRPPHPAP
ncbi:hypothetical protein GCM10012284_40000 [Mangrovihabitans endophyticus]|uniref:Uncharacterized protein n=1 Tax=Mangrovihabitans endophyticus TaxID=1751298 RepID=A0A8J3FQW8_9ACTN|nr:hypothetical protein GCM10012284_40000 [Mangrovihabitans endophyticus]